ncbi:hypothetical protein CHRYSEOSP005_25020 [Chryseobacterium sp. Alg-005]
MMRKFENIKRCNVWKQKKIIFKLSHSQIYQIKMASDLHHTATTDYLCCVPTLEDSQELVV